MEIAFSILGSVASIVGLIMPASGWKQRIVHLIYGVAIVVLAYLAVSVQVRLDRVASIERAASQMVEDREMKYTQLGFVHAPLAFLEKNSDLYPDTYQRAQNMCKEYQCDSPEGDSVNMVQLSFAMEGLLQGIATIDSED